MTLLVAEGGEAGLKLAVERRPRLVVLESELPGVGCETTVIRLRNQAVTSQVPIVVLSSVDSPMARMRLLLAGANAFLTKPLDVAKVDRIVAELLEARSFCS